MTSALYQIVPQVKTTKSQPQKQKYGSTYQMQFTDRFLQNTELQSKVSLNLNKTDLYVEEVRDPS